LNGKNDVLITDIIKKVREELKNLEIEKNVVMSSLKDVGGQIRTIDKKEMQLRAKIESLVKREADMSKRKVKLEKKLESIRKKLSKLSEAQKSISQAF
jgi:chromosome segregation ATPase